MNKQNYTLGQRCMAYILLFSLFLQNCTNPAISLGPNKQEAIEKHHLQTGSATFKEVFTPVIEVKEPRDKEGPANKQVDSLLEDSLSTTVKYNDPEGLHLSTSSLPADLTQEQKLASKQVIITIPQPSHQTSSKLLADQQTKSKPVENSLQVKKGSRQQAQQAISAFQPLVADKAPLQTKQASGEKLMITKGRFQIMFEKNSKGSWKAFVNESFQVGISRKMELPVFFELGYNLSHVVNSHLVHMAHQADTGSFIWVGTLGIKGGMHQEDEDDNNHRNTHSNGAKAEEIPSDLSGKLKYLYRQDDTLPRLIEEEDEKIPVQSIQDYYVNLQVVLQEDLEQERSAAARDQVVGKKKPLEVADLLDEIDQDHPAVGKVLLLGGAGIGKSTLMHYTSYQWGQGKLWEDKYEYVFRVRLKELLSTQSNPASLADFIHSCLDAQKTDLATKEGKEQVQEIAYELTELKDVLKNKQDKVLLLVDGYDEIASLRNETKYKKVLDLGVFKHPHVIMTSRPNAASKDIRAKFERQVESQGLDEAGINQYINLQFKQEPDLGEALKKFLASNSQVRSMCEVPINTALLCITWKDPETRAKLSSSNSMQTDFKLGQLYQALIVWLGKRYIIKYNPTKVFRDLSDEAVVEEKVFKALERIAYQTFTGRGLEDQARQGGTLGIPGQLVDQLARKESSDLDLTQLHRYGLFKGEGDPNKPLTQTYYFIHLTFQEYLTAHHLCQLLSQKDPVKEVSTWLAYHRNEPKYLMTLKFLAGLVNQSEDERLVRRFWEAMSCNVDGVIELGVEGKIKLFMHLLSQSKIGGNFDKRIPNLGQIEKLVDNTLQKDLVKWQQAIIEAGYFPTWLQQAASKGLQEGMELARKGNLSEGDGLKLQVATELISKMAIKGVFNKTSVFIKLRGLIELQDWRLQRLGLEKAREVVDKRVSKELLEESIGISVKLLKDENLKEVAKGLVARMAHLDLQGVLKRLEPLLADDKYDVRSSVAVEALGEIVKGLPQEEVEAALELFKPLLADSNEYVRRSTVDALAAIVKGLPQEKVKVAFDLVKPLLADKVNYKFDALAAIVKDLPQDEVKDEVKAAFKLIKSLLADKDQDHRWMVVHDLLEVVQFLPQDEVKAAFELIKSLLADKDQHVRSSAFYALGKIVQFLPQDEVKAAFELIKPLLGDKDKDVRWEVGMALEKTVQALLKTELKTTLELVKPLLIDKDKNVRSNAFYALKAIVEGLPKTKLKSILELIKPLLTDENKDVRESTVEALGAIVKRLLKDAIKVGLEVIKPLLSDKYRDVRSSTVEALGAIVEDLPQDELKAAFELVKPLLADKYKNVQWKAVNALAAIAARVKDLPKDELKVALELVNPLLTDENYYVHRSAFNALEYIVKGLPKDELKIALELFKPLLADKYEDVRSSAVAALGTIAQGLPQDELKAAFELIKPLLDDKDKGVRWSAVHALGEIVQVLPQHEVKAAFELIKSLLGDSNIDVRSRAVHALAAIVTRLPQDEVKAALELVKPLLGDSEAVDALAAIVTRLPQEEALKLVNALLASKDANVRRNAFYALEAIVDDLPKGALKAVFNLAKPLLADGDYYVQRRKSAVETLGKIVQGLPQDEVKEAFELIKPPLADEDDYVRGGAVKALGKIVQGLPKEELKAALELVKPLLSDEDEGVRRSAVAAFGKILKRLPEPEVKGALEVIKRLLNAIRPMLDATDYYVESMAKNTLEAIVKRLPQEEAFKLVKPLLTDWNKDIRKRAVAALGKVVKGLPFTGQVSLVTNTNPEVRQQAKEALAAMLKSPGAITQLNHQALGNLLEIIRGNKDQQEEVAQALYTGANQALAYLAGHLNPEGLAWLHSHLEELPNLPEAQAFLKAVIHHTLQDGVIDLQEANLLIKCIVERGLTATIDPQANQIILEDTTYTLQPASQAHLNHVVNEVIRLSQDPTAQQYKLHQPLFTNSGEGLPLATADIEKVGSILDKKVLDSDSWHVSVLDLSDHHQRKPSTTFILLEQRNYAGAHVIHQLKLDKEGSKVISHAINPISVDQIRKAIFGEMAYIKTKPRYYAYTFTLSQELGKKLLEAAQQIKDGSAAYSALHTLAGAYQTLHAHQERTANNLLSLAWEEYSKHPAVREYKKEDVLLVDTTQVSRDSIFIASQERIEAHHEEIKSHQEELAENKKKIEDHGNQVITLASQVSKQEQQIAKQDTRLDKQELQVERHDQQLKDQHVRLDKQELQVAAHDQQIKDIKSILDLAGVQADAAIKTQLQAYQTKEKELFDYCTTFIWTLKAYMDAYLVGSSGLLATNQEGSKVEEVAYKTGRNAVSAAVNLIPFVGGFVASMLTDALDRGRDAIKQAKQDNKIAAINALLTKNHALPSELEKSIAQAALKIAERKKSIIINPPATDKSRLGELGDKVSALTDKLLKNHQIGQSPQAELAVKDVVALMIRLYQEYELANENRSKDDFPTQLAELVCVGSLEDMVAQSANKLDVSLVSGVFKPKTLQKLQEKAAKGLWKSTRLKRGKECEAYLKEAYIKEYLTKKAVKPVAVSKETISASRAVLFEALCKGIVATKEKKPASVLVCAQAFAQAYPALTKQIAADYPTYFMDRQIAAECIKDDPALLAAVQSKLPPVSRFQ